MKALFADLPVAFFRKLFRKVWLRRIFPWIVIAGLCAAIWYGLELIGREPFISVWLRASVIGGIIALLGLYYGIRWMRRRRAAAALEEDLMPRGTGDGAVLAERMDAALAKLKKSGGKTYLYDLPWYIIIGPPGAGKTTALRYSGIEFPGQEQFPDGAQGFGGTRNCDWWFAEDAILIDTAGRYITQDSDVEVDKASWTAFLDLLKKGRPDQPINGAILAISIEDIMRADPANIAAHAKTVRARLAEIHEVLRIDFPVYVLFTKTDLVAGFREYFSSFSQSRRNGVWGVTFQTRDRNEQTHDKVPAEFDALLARLSDEVIDRMSEEPEATSRIAIFGLPGQMAMLRDGVTEFLRQVFGPTRYKTSAILRGFYFTSGTQEGTPFDQVLGNIAREDASGPVALDFMSGRGKSFFLRDVLQKVIFEERDWVNYDRGAVRRMTVMRSLSLATIMAATVASMGAFGYSFWRNAALVASAESEAAAYLDASRNVLDETLISDPNPTAVLDPLNALRTVVGGPDRPAVKTIWEGFGLSRHDEVTQAAEQAYGDGLERLLRPRMMLQLQQDIPQHVADRDFAAAYQALKVYLLLGGQGVGDGDETIVSHFQSIWQRDMGGAGTLKDREALETHLRWMLAHDGDRSLTVLPEEAVVARARQAIAGLSLEDQAWAAILSGVPLAGLEDFNLVAEVQDNVRTVFRTTDGEDLSSLRVSGLYTFDGYWGYFVDEIFSAQERLEDEQWVLGDAGQRADYAEQLANLKNALVRRYRLQFKQAWEAMFANLELSPMSADAPAYDVMAFAAANNSPLLKLVQRVSEQTQLTRLYDDLGKLGADDLASLATGGGGLAGGLADAGYNRMFSRAGVFQKVILEFAKTNVSGKTGVRAGAAGALAEDQDRRDAEQITGDFELWHAMIDGEPGARDIDRILAALEAVRANRSDAAFAASAADDIILNQALDGLTRNNGARPAPMARMLNGVEAEFLSAADDATLTELNQKLTETVTFFCRDNIKPFHPFSDSQTHVSPSIFGQFFGAGGLMDQFYGQHLRPHVLRTANGLEPDPTSRIGARLSRRALRQFDRAQAIQQAFFPGNEAEPKVRSSIKHLSSSESVQLATLTIHGRQIVTQPNSTPAEFIWPGATSGISVELVAVGFDAATPRFDMSRGRWDIVNFLRGGRARGANVIDVTKTIQGVSITYRFEFDSPTIPFLMRELADFNCPVSLEDR